MKTLFKLIVGSFFFLLTSTANAQVLISLLFGEALNSDKVEFGLLGGFNRSYINTISTAEGLNNFNLGFYFHINLEGNSFLSTGVLVKSNVGASGMPTYAISDEAFDVLFQDGELTKKIHYFYVPIMWHQRFNNRWYLEGGMQVGLRNKASDFFDLEYAGGDLSFKIDARDQYSRLDAGFVGGVGYKWKKELKSISSGVSYYYGLVNVSQVPDVTVKNSSLNVYIKVPIGASGKKKGQEDKSVVD